MQFSDQTLERFERASHQGIRSRPSVVGLSGSLETGLFMLVALTCTGGVVSEARFRSFNCISAIAAGDLVCEWAEGSRLAAALEISACRVDAELGGLPQSRLFCADLAERALGAALAEATRKGLLHEEP